MPCEGAGLQADRVSFWYERDEVLKDVSFGLRRGEMVALAGPNGSGKTTLLKVLSGVRPARSGSVTLDGEDLRALRSRRIARHIAVVSQHVDPSLMFTVSDIVAMGRSPYAGLFSAPSAEDRSATERALIETETHHLADRRFGELSGGEQQRVMLAMALAQNAGYLLLDEPTVHLDLHHQHAILELLRRLHQERQIGILAVMHDLNLAALYFQRLALMHAGRLVSDRTPAETLSRSEHLAIFRAPLSVVTHPQTGVPQVLLERGP
jgi:ABC-type cobalamin/Fe3+-siderophores transport system ATPase subunit